MALPSRCEEILQQCGGFLRANSGPYFDAMIQARMIKNGKARSHRATLRIIRAVDEALDARLYHGSGAHCTRLNRHVQRSAWQPIISDCLRGLAERENLGMRRRIAVGDGTVTRSPHNSMIDHNDRAHGYLSSVGRGAGLCECLLHECVIGFFGVRHRVPE